jgi:HAE1 family hydrophobic/amphiphilic exporter-1
MPTPPPAPTDPAMQEPREPNFPNVQAQPVPPLPDLSRIGIVSSNVITLSMNDAIRKALQNNNDIEIARDDVRIAEYGLQSLYGFYDPVFSRDPNLRQAHQSSDEHFRRVAPPREPFRHYLQSEPHVVQELLGGGGAYTLGFANSKTVTSATSSTLNPFYSSNLSLSFNQPLWRNRSIDATRHSIRIQKKFIEQSDSDFRARTISIISQVQAAYWNLVFALRNQQNQLESLNVSRQNMRIIEAQIEAGAKAPLDRAQVQTDIASRETTFSSRRKMFRCGKHFEAVDAARIRKRRVDRSAYADRFAGARSCTSESAARAGRSHKNRPEIRRLNLQKEINGLDLQYYNNQTKPQINLTGTVATTGLAGTNILPRLLLLHCGCSLCDYQIYWRLRSGLKQLVWRDHT